MLDIEKDVTDFLAGREDPVKIKSILKNLGLPNQDRQYLRSLLDDLVSEGKVVKQGTRYWIPSGKQSSLEIKRAKNRQRNQLVGRLTVTSRGFGFVENTIGDDWFIPEDALGDGRHGDLVLAQRVDARGGDRVSAEVVNVEEFGVRIVLGIFENRGKDILFTPFGSYQISRNHMINFPEEVNDGAVGRFNRLDSGDWSFAGMLGDMEDPFIDEQIVLAENDLETHFPQEALDECEAVTRDFEFSPEGRRDFRDELVFTVDGRDAKDFDDALHFKMLSSGQVEVGVHIADVATFVKPGSVLDELSSQRGNSIYLPHKAFPMLPDGLSSNLCSLRPGEPRYTLSCVVVMEKDGRVVSYELTKGIIESSYRLTYSDVVAIGVDKDPEARERFKGVTSSVDLALRLSRSMRKRRKADGGLSLDMGELRIKLNDEQLLEEVVHYRQTDANRMIEAFMCMANECVAKHMFDLGIGIPYRCHDQPDSDKLMVLANFLRSCGFNVPPYMSSQPARAINELIEKLADNPSSEVLQTQILKSLKMAEYHPTNHWHFGLGSQFYCHFTSPIRRYADLKLHHRLTAWLADKNLEPEYFDDSDLADTCRHISKKERSAARAEQTFKQIKLLRRMLDEIGNEFDGVITEVTKFGLFVKLEPWEASGLVHMDVLDDDFYVYNPEMLALVGKRSGRVFRVGGAVRVQVQMVDLVGRRLDLGLIGHDEETEHSMQHEDRRRKRDQGRQKVKRTLNKGGRKKRRRR